jgi:hypothetical protein
MMYFMHFMRMRRFFFSAPLLSPWRWLPQLFQPFAAGSIRC